MSTNKIDKLCIRIKIIRESAGLSKKNFAAKLEISAPYVTELESGKAKSISNSLAKLIEYEFGYNMNWILKGEGERRKTGGEKQTSLVTEPPVPPH